MSATTKVRGSSKVDAALKSCIYRKGYEDLESADSLLAQAIARNVSQPTDVIKVDPDAELLNARMYIRGRPDLKLQKPLFGIGTSTQFACC